MKAGDRLSYLIEAYLDKRLQPEERVELEQMLLGSDEARRQFWQESALHGLMHEAVRMRWSEAPASAVRPGLLDWIREWISWQRMLWAGGAVAALFLLALWVVNRQQPQQATPAFVPPQFARFTEVSGEVSILRAGQSLVAAKDFALEPLDEIRSGAGASAQVRFADGTAISVEALSQVTLSGTGEVLLENGRIAADVAPQQAGRLFRVRTGLAQMTVHGTEFTVDARARATRLSVTEGLVSMAHTGQSSEMQLAAGEFALAMPGAELLGGFIPSAPGPGSRKITWDVILKPFSGESPWNRAVPPGARYEEIVAPALDLAQHGAVVMPARHDRPVYVARAGDPETRITMRYDGSELARIRVPAAALQGNSRPVTCTIIDAETGIAHELTGASRQGSDILAALCLATDLGGEGVPPAAVGHTYSGMPFVAGMIRQGELTQGIRHALSASVIHPAINREGGTYVWPARHVPMESHKVALLGTTGNLRFGTLLAIPRGTDLSKLGVGTSGPAFEIAKALQDYGVYITHSYPPVQQGSQGNWRQPHLQFFADVSPEPDWMALAPEISKLVHT